MMKKFIQFLKTSYMHVLSALFFLGGFAWDALTIGRKVASSDLWIFFAYLVSACILVYLIGRPRIVAEDYDKLAKPIRVLVASGKPYMALQFLYGSLLSALFILYFKSSGYWLAWLITIGLGTLLVANEFLENKYRRHTTTWAMLGLCSMLFFNFAFPFVLGSVHAAWFYISTLLGALIVTWIYKKTPEHVGSIKPVWIIAIVLMVAYWFDAIPPVPLVAQDTAIGYEIEKDNGQYQVIKQAAPKIQFWHSSIDTLYRQDKVVCFSAIFAPPGISTALYHDWQYDDPKLGWKTISRVKFDLVGGRQQGFRGYTYKTNLITGSWRVLVTTEQHKTIAIVPFKISNQNTPKLVKVRY
jgi:hypothetical protein